MYKLITFFLIIFLLPGRAFLYADKFLNFGMSTVLSGPNADLGRSFSLGVRAAFNWINSQGGIRGKFLKLIVLDDSYDPHRTIKNMHKLIEKDYVLGIIGNVGTPTGVVAMPIAIRNKVLFFAPFTGASALRPDPPNPYVYHYRASYYEELKYVLSHLLKCTKISPTEVAFFTQNDAYGDEIFTSGLKVLKKLGLKKDEEEEIIHVRYPRNTFYIHKAAAVILRINSSPKVIVLGGTYSSCAEFIKVLRGHGYRGYFVSVSFIGAEALAKIARNEPLAGEGVIISEVVPPLDEGLPLVKEYLQELKKLAPAAEPNFVSFEGYVAGKILIKALNNIKGRITRESLVKAMAHLGEFDIGLGVPLKIDAKHHQASHYVWTVKIKKGNVVSFNLKRCEVSEVHQNRFQGTF